MSKFVAEFTSGDKKRFQYKIGSLLASSLSGFLAGIVVASLFFLTVFDVSKRF